MYTITRKKLIEIAFDAIQGYEAAISPDNRKHLLYAACTIDKIALGDWVVSPTCGCLVGSAYLNALDTPEDADLSWVPGSDAAYEQVLTADADEAYALEVLGMDFDDLLRAEVGGVNAPAEVEVLVID